MSGKVIQMTLSKHVDVILNHEEYMQLANYTHHRPFTTLEHSVRVAQISYNWSKRLEKTFNLDTHSITRGALLHDFFLYDWHKLRPDGSRWHGFRHPRIALNNAERCFELNEKEKDIILSHMWPLTPRRPKSREAFLVMIADKIASIQEFRYKFRRELPTSARCISLNLFNCEK